MRLVIHNPKLDLNPHNLSFVDYSGFLYNSNNMSNAEVLLLCGPAGSGKTTYAERLVANGALKLSIDESMNEQHGRAGIDFDVSEYREREISVMEEHKARMVGSLALGQSVILDYGFPSKSERDEYKAFIESIGAQWRLLYFKADRDTLISRLRLRNESADANALPVSEELLDQLLEWFEAPDGEGEEIIEAA